MLELTLEAIVILIVSVAAVATYLAFCFTLVKESSAKAVVRFNGFRKMLFRKVDWKLDEACNLVKAEGLKHLFGGLCFVSWLKPLGIDKIYKYNFSWVKVLPGDDQVSYVLKSKHEDNVDHILVGQIYVYGMNIRGREVVDRDMVPLEISLALPAMIVNPRKALFDTKDWFNSFVSLVGPAVVDYVNDNRYQHMIDDKEKSLGADVFKVLNTPRKVVIDEKKCELSVVRELEKLYGVRLLAVQCKGIRQEGKYQDQQTQQWQAQRDAERDLTKRLGSTTATLMAMIAEQTGAKKEEIQAEFRVNPDAALKKYAGLIAMGKDFIEQQIASDAKALRRYYFSGGTGGLDLIALLGDVFRGKVAGGDPSADRGDDQPPSGQGGTGEKKFEDMTLDELKARGKKRGDS